MSWEFNLSWKDTDSEVMSVLSPTYNERLLFIPSPHTATTTFKFQYLSDHEFKLQYSPD